MIALIVLSFCPALLGIYLSNLLRKRVESLEKVELMFSLIENNIAFLSLPSVQLIQILTGKEELRELGFLSECNEMLMQGMNFRDAWLKSLTSRRITWVLNGSDIALLRLFCENFGTADIKSEISNCRFCKSILKDNINKARLNREKYGNVLSFLGFFIGVALTIMLC